MPERTDRRRGERLGVDIERLGSAVQRGWRSAATRWTLLCCTVFFLLLNAWGLRLFSGAVDYSRFGDVGEWVSGIGTIAAFVAAVLAIRIGQKKDAEGDVQKRTSLYTWIRLIDDESLPRGWYLYLANACSAPIYLWRLEVTGVGHLSSAEVGPLPPGITMRRLDIADLTSAATNPDALCVSFLDAEGFGWQRYGARAAVEKPAAVIVKECSESSSHAVFSIEQ